MSIGFGLGLKGELGGIFLRKRNRSSTLLLFMIPYTVRGGFDLKPHHVLHLLYVLVLILGSFEGESIALGTMIGS